MTDVNSNDKSVTDRQTPDAPEKMNDRIRTREQNEQDD